jgi:tetratricopeptide (TPR) repeat protein
MGCLPRVSTASLAVSAALALAAQAFVPRSAHAEAAPAAPQQHGPHLKAAIRLYQKLDLDAALAELRLAEDEAKSSEPEMVTTLLYQGLIFAESGKYAQTMEHFKRALAMSPWLDVPEGTAPRIARQFSDARRELWGSGGIKPPPRKRPRGVAAGGAAPAAEPVAPLPSAPKPSPATTGAASPGMPADKAAPPPLPAAPADKTAPTPDAPPPM